MLPSSLTSRHPGNRNRQKSIDLPFPRFYIPLTWLDLLSVPFLFSFCFPLFFHSVVLLCIAIFFVFSLQIDGIVLNGAHFGYYHTAENVPNAETIILHQQHQQQQPHQAHPLNQQQQQQSTPQQQEVIKWYWIKCLRIIGRTNDSEGESCG